MSYDEYSDGFATLRTEDLETEASAKHTSRLPGVVQQNNLLREENTELKNCLRVLRENTEVETNNIISSVIGWNDVKSQKNVSEYKNITSSIPSDNEDRIESSFVKYSRKSNVRSENPSYGVPRVKEQVEEIQREVRTRSCSPSLSPMSSFCQMPDTNRVSFHNVSAANDVRQLEAGSAEFLPARVQELERTVNQDLLEMSKIADEVVSQARQLLPPEQFRDLSAERGHFNTLEPTATSTPISEVTNHKYQEISPVTQRSSRSPSPIRDQIFPEGDPMSHRSRSPSPTREPNYMTSTISSRSRSNSPKHNHNTISESFGRSRSPSPNLENYRVSTVTSRSRSPSPKRGDTYIVSSVTTRSRSPSPNIEETYRVSTETTKSRSPSPNIEETYRVSTVTTSSRSPSPPGEGKNHVRFAGADESSTGATGGVTSTPFNSYAEHAASVSLGSRSVSPSNTDDTSHREDEDQSYRILGEIAFQLERRILDYVFSFEKTKLVGSRHRRRFYGYTVSNIPAMIARESEGVNGRYDPCREFQIRSRLNMIIKNLSPLGYNIEKHGFVSQNIINKYGLLGSIPNKHTMDAFGMNDDDTLRVLVNKVACDDEERLDVMILLECLLVLAHQDGKPILLW